MRLLLPRFVRQERLEILNTGGLRPAVRGMRSIGPALTLCACIATAAALDGCAPGPTGSSTTDQGTGGGTPAAGGNPQTGGTVGSGGRTALGGMIGGGGSTASGGSTGTGGTTAAGGATATGGAGGSGGVTGRGGTKGSGGTTGAAGTAGSGGATSSGGASGSNGGSSSGGTVGAGGSSATGGTAGSGATGPCDIYQAGNAPCGAAHSTVRALYGAYTGPLYQVQRASDKATKDIPVGSGGFADASVQDSFCAGTTCTIPIIYDQSPNGNHLRVTWFAYWLQSGGNPASATAARSPSAGTPSMESSPERTSPIEQASHSRGRPPSTRAHRRSPSRARRRSRRTRRSSSRRTARIARRTPGPTTVTFAPTSPPQPSAPRRR